MASDKPHHTVTDYMAAAISPAFIMILVGSLVFFLVEVLYVGQYSGQLLWCLFFFVFAAVLIARISIEAGWGRASLFGSPLAVVIWLALQFYVEYPPDSPVQDVKWAINLGLIALTWWCAHRLTWDCTFVEDKDNDGGQGLLQAAGLEKPAAGAVAEESEPAAGEPPQGWWERYKRYRAERAKRRTPGVWVVYFSLAALPLFGLGQSLIPVEEEGRRQYVFWLMVLYVGSGLGLLLTTTFLGLRRYLRQRQVQMPTAMTGVWLTTGGGLIVALLLIGALLPRPQAEYPIVEIPGITSPERQASRFAYFGGKPGKGEGQRSAQKPPDGKQDPNAPQGKRGEDGQKTDDKSSPEGKEGNKSGGQKDGQDKRDDQQGDERGKPGEEKDSKGRPTKDQREQKDDKGGDRKQAEQQSGGQSQNQREGQPRRNESGQRNQSAEQTRPSSNSFLGPLAGLASILKWIVFAVLAIVVLFLVLRGGLRFLANFSDWAKSILDAFRSWWQALFGSRGAGGKAGEEEGAEPVGGAPRKPFASYHNPFLDGRAERLTTEKLVRYSFEALEAWAWEHNLGRQPDETALEFAQRIGAEVPALERDVRRLAGLYARVLYARGGLPASSAEAVQQFWERLEAVVEQPMSA